MANSAVTTAAAFLLCVAAASAIPVRYDQRQDGDWNVDAKLQNFFVVLAPQGNSPNNGGASAINLLEFASKAVPLRLPVRPGSGLPAAAAAAVAAVSGTPVPGANDPQDRQGVEVGSEVVPAARAALQYFAAPASPEASVTTMLVAVPVPEVAPMPGGAFVSAIPIQSAITPNHIEPHPQPTALLPMLAVIRSGTTDKIIPVHSVPIEALSSLQPSAEKAPLPEIAPNPAPASIQPAPEMAAQETAPIEQAAPFQPTPNAPAQAVEPGKETLRLVGTGIEECGPSRIRNAQGICEDARS